MSSPGSLISGVIAAFAGIFISAFFYLSIGMPAEAIVKVFAEAAVYNVPAAWQSYDYVLFYVNLVYIVASLPALVGIIVLFMSSIKTQEYDVIGGENDPAMAQPQYVTQQDLFGGQ